MSNRRQFLKQAAVAGAAVSIFTGGTSAATIGQVQKQSIASQPPKVIFLVSDGMSTAVPSLAEKLSQIVRGRGTHFYRLLGDPKVAHGHMETHSLNSLVTDSAAAATSWGSGTRVFNGAINMLPDGTELTPILRLLKEAGFGTGLVTTATVTHATPAGFAAVQAGRGDEEAIAPQYLDVVDVIMGGGFRFFDGTSRKDNIDQFAAYAGAGYAVARSREELAFLADKEKALGIFDNGHLPYTVDHLNDPALLATMPTLAEMTETALAVLNQNPNGFLLQVEGARVDHAAHGNDTAAILWDQIAFDDAVEVALRFQQKHPETLIVVTSDHGNANPGLNGIGSNYLDSDRLFASLANAKSSYWPIRDQIRAEANVSAEAVRQIIKDALGIEIKPEEAAVIATAATGGKVQSLNAQHASYAGVMGNILGNYTGVWWTSTQHTEDITILAAKGPGQDAWRGLQPNVSVFAHLTAHFGIKHVNPSMTPEDARKYQANVAATKQADWA